MYNTMYLRIGIELHRYLLKLRASYENLILVWCTEVIYMYNDDYDYDDTGHRTHSISLRLFRVHRNSF